MAFTVLGGSDGPKIMWHGRSDWLSPHDQIEVAIVNAPIMIEYSRQKHF